MGWDSRGFKREWKRANIYEITISIICQYNVYQSAYHSLMT